MILFALDGEGPLEQQLGETLHREVAVLSAADLCTPGWCFDPADPGATVVVAAGIPRRLAALDAVICAAPAATPEHLPMVDPADRGYVAAELTALLIVCLATASCPVLNPPRGGCLSGPGWAPERWALLASRAGVPTWPLHRAAVPADLAAAASGEVPPGVAAVDNELVTVCGTHAADTGADPVLVDHVRRLVAVSGVPLLSARFVWRDGAPLLTGVLPWPDLSVPGLGAAVDAYLRDGAS